MNVLKHGSDKLLKLLRYIPGFRWMEAQVSVGRLSSSFLSLCLLGFVPGCFHLSLVAIGLLAILNKNYILEHILNSGQTINEFRVQFNQTSGKAFGILAVDHSPTVFKYALSFFILFTIPMPFCFLGIYGLLRYPNDEWRRLLNQRWQSIAEFFHGMAKGIHSRTTFYKRLNIVLIGAPILAALIHYQGGFFVFNLVFSLVQYGCIYIGFRAFIRDCVNHLKQPIAFFLDYTGMILGAFWGRYLAHVLISGRVYGNMGPAVGHVIQNGFFANLFSVFLNPNSWFVGFETGFAYLLRSRISSFLHGVMNAVFFSADMRLQGDFWGDLGPSSFQLFLAMAAGAYVGYSIQRWVDNAGTGALHQINQLQHNAANLPRQEQQMTNLNQVRWTAAFIVGAAPLFLLSPIGAPFLALSSGNIFLAQLLIMLFTSTTFFSVFAVSGLAVEYLKKRYRPEEAPSVSSLPAALEEEDEIGSLLEQGPRPILHQARSGDVGEPQTPAQEQLPQQTPTPGEERLKH